MTDPNRRQLGFCIPILRTFTLLYELVSNSTPCPLCTVSRPQPGRLEHKTDIMGHTDLVHPHRHTSQDPEFCPYYSCRCRVQGHEDHQGRNGPQLQYRAGCLCFDWKMSRILRRTLKWNITHAKGPKHPRPRRLLACYGLLFNSILWEF